MKSHRRRKTAMMLFLVLIISAILLLSYAHWVEPSLLLTKTTELTLRENGKTTDSQRKLRVVWFSDTHFGNYYESENMRRIAEQINGLNPELVLFGGDLMDSYLRYPPNMELLREGLSAIKAPYGKFAVYGNHDYGGGARQVYSALMEKSGFQLLQNETLILEEIGVSLTGLDDYLLGHPDTSLPEELPENTCNLLLSHAPDLVDRLELERVRLVLSGHTHGGQVYVPFVVNAILPQGGKKYRKGLYPLGKEADTKLLVSSGIGMTQIPLRLANPPEILCLELTY